ncbi:PREDICTED: rho guanine nucleotide exchange factor 1, partial [Sturnus vulgaris]|uniref:rho guanine nucleotide exchange factor 1 n=1 Tax=Sturnus vulgaris TaxID=9172 RepID=UPI00071A1098
MEPEEGFNGPPCAGARGPAAAAIIGAEDEDFENDIEPTPEEQNSQFQSLELLRQHPLSLMAFLQHVVLQFDSCPVVRWGGGSQTPPETPQNLRRGWGVKPGGETSPGIWDLGLEPGGPGGGGDPPPFLPRQPEEAVPRLEPELEQEPPAWRELADPAALLRLPQREVRRQEVINELFLTEHAHVRMLRVLLELFYQPMLRDGFFDEQELSTIFPSLEDLVEVHSEVPGTFRCRPGILGVPFAPPSPQFEGTEGSWFQKISARFCSRQSFALEQLKAKQRKDTRFNQFIQEAESRPRCRRLQLKDIIPTEMQRLTKYPLLLLSITKCTEAAAERAKVEQAAECCRHILNHVNQEVRDMENLMKLKDYQRRLDLSNVKQSTDPLLSEFRVRG